MRRGKGRGRKEALANGQWPMVAFQPGSVKRQRKRQRQRRNGKFPYFFKASEMAIHFVTPLLVLGL